MAESSRRKLIYWELHMNRRILSTAVLVASSLVSTQAVHAAPLTLPSTVHAMFAKTKLVSFSLRNDSAAPLKIMAGDSAMTIDAGKTLAMKLPAGTSVTAVEATSTLSAGAVITQVTGELSGATIAIK